MKAEPKHVRLKREAEDMRLRLRALPCYQRLCQGQLTVDDCHSLDQALEPVRMALTMIHDAWFAINVQTCHVIQKEWRHGGARWLGEQLAKSPPEVFKAYDVTKTLKPS